MSSSPPSSSSSSSCLGLFGFCFPLSHRFYSSLAAASSSSSDDDDDPSKQGKFLAPPGDVGFFDKSPTDDLCVRRFLWEYPPVCGSPRDRGRIPISVFVEISVGLR